MINSNVNKSRLPFLFVPVVVALLGLGVISFKSTHQSLDMSRWVSHTMSVIGQLRDVIATIERADSSQKWFLATGNTKFESLFEKSAAAAYKDITELTEKTSDNRSQQDRIEKLKPLLDQKIQLLRNGITVLKSQNRAAALRYVHLHQGTQVIESIRVQLSEIEAQERLLLSHRNAVVQSETRKAIVLFPVSILVAAAAVLAAWFFAYRELVARKKTNLRLNSAKRLALDALSARSKFFANISHEIRTPLHAIVGMADVLSANPTELEKATCISVIKRAGNTLTSLIDDVLDLSKMEAGKFELNLQSFSLNETIDQCVKLLKFRADQKKIKIDYTVAKNLPGNLLGDPERISQVIYNLAGNAIKFTQQGWVTINVAYDVKTCSERPILISVQDTGIGIQFDKQKNLFEEFAQADSSIARDYGGTGLGLTISRQLVEMMRGKIYFDSIPGKGTKFYVELPSVEVEASPKELESVEDMPDQRHLRLIVADDIEDNRLLVQLYLKGLPYELEFAENGREVLEKVASDSVYDIILMDMHMPVLSGEEAVKEIRRREKLSNARPIPIIALTAFAMEEDIQRSMDAGCTRHLSKPIERITLKKVLLETARNDFVVQLKADMEPLMANFLKNRKNDLVQVAVALKEYDFASIEGVAHTFKGVAGSFGFPILAGLAQKMQDAAKMSDKKMLDLQLKSAQDYLSRLKIQFI